MWLKFKVAFRNVFRNKTRTLITLLAVSIGCIALILAGGFIRDSFYQLREITIRSYLGHLQVARKGFYEKGSSQPFRFLIEDPQTLIARIQEIPSVSYVTPRLEFSGLVSLRETTVSFLGQGVDPAGEKALNSVLGMVDGRMLEPEDTYSVILGRGLAASLDARVGDTLVLLANTEGGGINAVQVEVKGIFYTFAKAFDDRALRLPIRTAQELLYNTAVQTLVVVLDDTEQTDRVKARLAATLKDYPVELEIKPWYELADYYQKVKALYSRQFNVIKLIITIVVILSIMNTMSMSILERTGEIGTIMAMGFKRRAILGMFLLEGLILGVIGGFLGVVFGILAATVVSRIGIPMPPAPGSETPYTAHIQIAPDIVAFAFALAVVSALVSSFYPAYRASRLQVVEALRHNN